MKIKTYKNAYATIYQGASHNGMWFAEVRTTAGERIDRVHCESRRQAMAYYKSFCAIAKARA